MVFKWLDYFCNYLLLKDGNVLVDLLGIDVLVKEDVERVYCKIESLDILVVICVFKLVVVGDMSVEEI